MSVENQNAGWMPGGQGAVPLTIDLNRASVARIYDYLLGGSDNFPADRMAAERIADVYPAVWSAAQANRTFHERAAAYMARQGIRQFVDIGCGLPTMDNTHEIVRQESPGARVVYVDNDPQVVTHTGGLLALHNHGVAAVAGDIRHPETVLGDPAIRDLFRSKEPAGVLMTAVLHFVADSEGLPAILERYVRRLSAGSCVAISHVSADNLDYEAVQTCIDVYAQSSRPVYMRSREELQLLFADAGLRLVPPFKGAEPVVCTCGRWTGPDKPRQEKTLEHPGGEALWCGVGRL